MSKLKSFNAQNTVLVTLMNSPADFLTLQNEGWYRIRKGKRVPTIIKNRTAKYIAFYQTKKFKDNPCIIQYFGDVKAISEVTRKDLFPDEIAGHPKAKNQYFKIEVGNLRPLPKAIPSSRPRRILFIPTTEEKFFNTMHLQQPEINYLFNSSPLEDILFQKLLDNNIFPERQFVVHQDRKTYELDFMLPCKTANIDLECDGFAYHYKTTEQKIYDNKRNNSLTSDKWHVLRYNTQQLTEDIDNTILEIKKTIDRHGGIQDPYDKSRYYYVNQNEQMRLF